MEGSVWAGMRSATGRAISSSAQAAGISSRDLAWSTARSLSGSTSTISTSDDTCDTPLLAGRSTISTSDDSCSKISTSDDSRSKISTSDEACDASLLSRTSTGSSSSGEELRCLFWTMRWLRFGDHLITHLPLYESIKRCTSLRRFPLCDLPSPCRCPRAFGVHCWSVIYLSTLLPSVLIQLQVRGEKHCIETLQCNHRCPCLVDSLFVIATVNICC